MNTSSPTQVAEAFRQAILNRDPVSAEHCCTSVGWHSIGDSGRRLYQQGTRRLFDVVPFGRELVVKNRGTVFCDIRSEETNQHLDRLRLLMLWTDEGWRIEGICRHALQAQLFLEARIPAIFRYDELPESETGLRWGQTHLKALQAETDGTTAHDAGATPMLQAFGGQSGRLSVEHARVFEATASTAVCFLGQSPQGAERHYVFIRPDDHGMWRVYNEGTSPVLAAFLDQLPDAAFGKDVPEQNDETSSIATDNVVSFLHRERDAFRSELGERFRVPEIADAFRVVLAGKLGTDPNDASLKDFDLDTQFFVNEGPAIWQEMLEILGPVLPNTVAVALPSEAEPATETKTVENADATWTPEVVTQVQGKSVTLRINYADILSKLLGGPKT